MLNMIFSVLMLLQSPVDIFKKDMAPLQAAVDSVVTPIVGRVWQPAKATYLDGYGIVVTLEVQFEAQRTPFSTPASPAELRTIIAARRKDLSEKMTALVKQRVATTNAIAANESLAVVVHIVNFNPADLPNLPKQLVFSVRKDSPDPVVMREF